MMNYLRPPFTLSASRNPSTTCLPCGFKIRTLLPTPPAPAAAATAAAGSLGKGMLLMQCSSRIHTTGMVGFRQYIPEKDPIPVRPPSHKPRFVRQVEGPSQTVDVDMESAAVKLQKEAFLIIDKFNEAANPIDLYEQTKKAIKIIEEALTHNPAPHQVAQLYYGLGLCYMRQGDWLACEASYKKSVDAHADFVPAYEGMGEALMMQGHYELALGWFTKFCDTFPEYYSAFGEYSMTLNSEDLLAQILYKRGFCYYKAHDYTSAAGDFNHCIALERKYVSSSFYWLGKIASERGKLWDSIALLNKAIEKDPRNIAAYLERSDIYTILGKNELADEDRRKYQILKRETVYRKLKGGDLPVGAPSPTPAHTEKGK